MNFALLEQLAFSRHRLKYPWCDLLFTHIPRPIVIVDFNLLHAYATTRQYFRNLDFFVVVRIRGTILSIKDFLKIRILTYSYGRQVQVILLIIVKDRLVRMVVCV